MYEDYHAQYAAKLVSVDEALSHIHDGDVIVPALRPTSPPGY